MIKQLPLRIDISIFCAAIVLRQVTLQLNNVQLGLEALKYVQLLKVICISLIATIQISIK
jgi:hypothetical protein